MRGLFAPIALLAWLTPGLGIATPVWTDATKAQALIEAVAKGTDGAQKTVDDLAGVLQLEVGTHTPPPITRPIFVEGAPGKLVSSDLQLAMTQLSIHIGTNNQIRVMQAQGDHRDALILQSGTFTLRNLAKDAVAQSLDGISVDGDIVHLTRPLVVWQGAGLQIESGDQLQLDAKSGAFLLGFGQIELMGATVEAVNLIADPAAYRPFVLITGQGTIYAQDTQFTGLGMVGADPFSGVMVSQLGLFQPAFPPTFTQNRFDDVGIVAMAGVTNGVIEGNVIKAGRGGGISLAAVQGAVVSGNTVISTKDGSGVKVANGNGVQLTGNLVAGGARNGISIGGNSKGVEISGNAVLTNAQTGIATQRVTCVLVADNSIARNGASGLRLNETGVSRVQGNAMVLNTTAGLHVGAQNKGGRVEVSDNLLAGNRVGLTGVAIGEIVLDQNNLAAQMPRLFDGEFSQYLAAYLTQVQQNAATTYSISARDGRKSDSFLTACNKG
jgi:nitrous oxidase accessory protein NosD